MSLEADWSLRLVEFGVRQGNESKRIPVLIGRLVSVFFNDSRIVVSDKFADSSEPAISEENWCVRVDALAGAEGAGDGRGTPFGYGEEEVDYSLSGQERCVLGGFSLDAFVCQNCRVVLLDQLNRPVGGYYFAIRF